MKTETLALNNNWLESSQSSNQATQATHCMGGATGGLTMNGIGQTITTYGYYQPWYYPVYYSSPARPIKLTLSEVERLRKAAKADEKVKAILAKFTDQIEITVDFE